MNFDLTEVQRAWRDKGRMLGDELGPAATAADAVMGAARAGLLDPRADLLAVVLAIEGLAAGSPSGAMALAAHYAAALTVADDERFDALFSGEAVGALTLSTEEVPLTHERRLSGRASWVAPIVAHGQAIIGARHGDELMACAVSLDEPGVRIERVDAAALSGFVCAHLTFEDVPCQPVGPTLPVMSRARTFIASAGIGIGRRAVHEALARARGTSRGAGGEQTIQGLIADAATELDAAMLLTWRAASSPLSLVSASMAKLAATGAAQRAVEHATQVVGADTFRRGHIIERLSQDVRALELFAGRTEALREAVAEEELSGLGG